MLHDHNETVAAFPNVAVGDTVLYAQRLSAPKADWQPFLITGIDEGGCFLTGTVTFQGGDGGLDMKETVVWHQDPRIADREWIDGVIKDGGIFKFSAMGERIMRLEAQVAKLISKADATKTPSTKPNAKRQPAPAKKTEKLQPAPA